MDYLIKHWRAFATPAIALLGLASAFGVYCQVQLLRIPKNIGPIIDLNVIMTMFVEFSGAIILALFFQKVLREALILSVQLYWKFFKKNISGKQSRDVQIPFALVVVIFGSSMSILLLNLKYAVYFLGVQVAIVLALYFVCWIRDIFGPGSVGGFLNRKFRKGNFNITTLYDPDVRELLVVLAFFFGVGAAALGWLKFTSNDSRSITLITEGSEPITAAVLFRTSEGIIFRVGPVGTSSYVFLPYSEIKSISIDARETRAL